MPIEIVESDDKLNGVIGMFRHYDPNYLKIIKVEVSSPSIVNPQNLLFAEGDIASSGTNYPEKEPQWIKISFTKSFIQPTSYVLQSSINEESSPYHPIGWDLLGSVDNQNWFLLDRKHNSSDLLGEGKIVSYPCKMSNKFKHFKFLQYQPSSSGNYGFFLRRFEVFGSIYDSIYTIVGYRPIFKNTFLFIILEVIN